MLGVVAVRKFSMKKLLHSCLGAASVGVHNFTSTCSALRSSGFGFRVQDMEVSKSDRSWAVRVDGMDDADGPLAEYSPTSVDSIWLCPKP